MPSAFGPGGHVVGDGQQLWGGARHRDPGPDQVEHLDVVVAVPDGHSPGQIDPEVLHQQGDAEGLVDADR